ncbi:hypothetical protein CHS0354_027832 [Potamilus streckersoni]|uniref:Uncharacterized protein n=1 Tax=Potamilus streckersoni TaxID=2493646 RepID=A0AAE0T0L1_9BIVA|nr:hypothetical protein CHS0354_027832 [Potamilus streckersoni]
MRSTDWIKDVYSITIYFPQIRTEGDINNYDIFINTVHEYIKQVRQDKKKEKEGMKQQLEEARQSREASKKGKKKQSKQLNNNNKNNQQDHKTQFKKKKNI